MWLIQELKCESPVSTAGILLFRFQEAINIFLLEPTALIPMSFRSSSVSSGNTSSSTSCISNTGAYLLSPNPSNHDRTPPSSPDRHSPFRSFQSPPSVSEGKSPSTATPASLLSETLTLAALLSFLSDGLPDPSGNPSSAASSPPPILKSGPSMPSSALETQLDRTRLAPRHDFGSRLTRRPPAPKGSREEGTVIGHGRWRRSGENVGAIVLAGCEGSEVAGLGSVSVGGVMVVGSGLCVVSGGSRSDLPVLMATEVVI
ncbi:hypothetical protein C4D60_Mb05t26720 [Musa balbisiana]|uniref:Uncharacterized protein n=1 Tax=Musa balbisiana TaxID=52838 RepID=A0A4S8JZ49_MUSBA|nr:hypothetical protein C4D60_Mb05t26720 [Musa balbisiana]